MKTFSIIFKRTKDQVESIQFTCFEAELTGLLEYCEIYENNILSIMEVN